MRARLRSKRGFSVVEALVYFVIAVIAATSVYKLMLQQNRSYLKQRELQDVRGTLRVAANVLASQLRQASAAEGDIYSIAAEGFTIRSILGSGTICGEHSSQPRFGVWGASGYFLEEPQDSVLAYVKGSNSLADDKWLVLPVKRIWSPSGGGVPNCAWGDSTTIATDLIVQIDSTGSELEGQAVGAPIRAFRRIEYGLFEDRGRWWLGSKVGAAPDFEIMTGPLSPGGLQFTYYDAAGIPTLDPTLVRYVDISLLGESQGKVHVGGGNAPRAQSDSIMLRVALRG